MSLVIYENKILFNPLEQKYDRSLFKMINININIIILLDSKLSAQCVKNYLNRSYQIITQGIDNLS